MSTDDILQKCKKKTTACRLDLKEQNLIDSPQTQSIVKGQKGKVKLKRHTTNERALHGALKRESKFKVSEAFYGLIGNCPS